MKFVDLRGKTIQVYLEYKEVANKQHRTTFNW